MDDRCNRIEESEAVLPGRPHDTFGQRLGRQWPGGNDGRTGGGKGIDPFANDGDIGMFGEGALNFGGKHVAIDCHC